MTIYDDIKSIVETVPYGDVMLTVKRHSGSSQQLIIHSYESHKYVDNAETAAAIVKLIREASDRKYTGSLSFTIVVKDGTVTRLIKQENRQVDYSGKPKVS